MLKKFLYGLTLIAVMASCSDDYTDWASPQTNPEEKAKTVFGQKVDLWTYEDDLDFEVSVNSEHIMAEDGYGQMNFIRLILQNENGTIYCQCGDDFGEDLSNAVQVATILEMKYKQIEISEDDHFDYNSIRGTDLDI